MNAKRRGRPAIYPSHAARTKAYRERKNLRSVTVDVPIPYHKLVRGFAVWLRNLDPTEELRGMNWSDYTLQEATWREAKQRTARRARNAASKIEFRGRLYSVVPEQGGARWEVRPHNHPDDILATGWTWRPASAKLLVQLVIALNVLEQMTIERKASTIATSKLV